MERNRSASEDRARERPDEEEAPVKYVPPCLLRIRDQLTGRRARVDTTREDKARGKRMFGNILGTLQRFKKDDKNLRTSDAVGLPHRCRVLPKADNQAKKREQLSERIATKLRSETNLHTEILEKEKELKGLRISTDSADFVIKHKEATVCLLFDTTSRQLLTGR